MQIIKLYRYVNADGSVSITPPKKDETDVEYQYRLIADEDKVLTDGTTVYNCIDTRDINVYSEIDEPIDDDSANIDVYQKATAFDYLTGRSAANE